MILESERGGRNLLCRRLLSFEQTEIFACRCTHLNSSKGGGMQHSIDHIKASRITARILSALLFILWGAFFVEHLSWFSTEAQNTPPIQIWFAQVTHFLLLVGYLLSLKWEKIGSALITVSAVLFFSYAAGTNAVPFIVVSLFPVMLFAYCWMKQHHVTRIVS